MEFISSRNNKKIQNTIKLKNKKYRDRSSLFTFEGYKLFREALTAGLEFSEIFVREDAFDKYPELKKHNYVTIVSDNVYEKLTDDISPDGIFCIAKKMHIIHNEAVKKMIAISVRDPGNVGTIIRSALAFGIDELILTDDCADVYSPKVVRSAMGALFYQKITITSNIEEKIAELKNNGYNVYATALSSSSIPITDIGITKNTCFIIGNEGHGLDDDVIALCDGQVIIPIDPYSESLNAAVAAAILMWEMKRNS